MNTTTRTRSPSVADGLNVLADTTRSRILALLQRDEFAVGELGRVMQVPQPTVSRHLRILADSGWVASRAEGTSRHYRLAEQLPDDARALWELVLRDMEDAPFARRDLERAVAVVEERKDRSRAFFSSSAGRWDELRDELFGRRAELLPLFGLLDPTWVVADLGAGTGALARTVAPFVSRVVAVDRSPEMLAMAAERTAELREGGWSGRIELREGELEALPLADGEADLVVLSLVLHHLAEPEEVLAEVARIARPGGRVVVVEMREHDRVEYREEMGHLWLGFDPERMVGWMEEAGFGACAHRPLPPDPEAGGPLLFLAHGVRDGRERGQAPERQHPT